MPFTQAAALVRTRLSDAAANRGDADQPPLRRARRRGGDRRRGRQDQLVERARAVAAERQYITGPKYRGAIKEGAGAPLLADLAVTTPATVLWSRRRCRRRLARRQP